LLDAFAGSGALSIEAVSRGAASVTAIDIDKRASESVSANISDLGISEKIKVIRANAGSWSDLNQDKKFDIVLLDPPYDRIKPMILFKLIHHAKKNGVIILSLPPTAVFSLAEGFDLLAEKTYGDARVDVYRKISAS
jgi:16S rRNA (guanine(966)-N(2))-methyltransferase RsmD